ncbi:hypothetical protein [Bacillus cytotoxicus]|uniref:hypothetical protein n=1 Tax=Bacillus cytotoxicus TaxID=580165 RepID=UPI002447AE65|nr:hypothetical protein [Bacillus cytotoxicus]MDH2882518.1 hypothetical protein [Bacillus cytotoxicus]
MKLKDNGFDSLKRAMITLNQLPDFNDDNFEFEAKEVILKLHHAIETLFKHLIREKGNYLIYSDLKDFFEKESHKLIHKNSAEHKKLTIYFEESIQRAIALYNYPLKPNQYKAFTDLNELRNSLTHHEYNFEEKETEYISTQILIVLLDFLGKNITDFKEFIKKESLDLKLNDAKAALEITQYIGVFSVYEKINNGKIALATLQSNQTNFNQKLQSISKDKHYHECPICHKPYFVKEGIFTELTDEVGYYGSCKLCEFEINKLESIIIHWLFGEIKEFEVEDPKVKSIINDLIFEEVDFQNKLTDNDIISFKNIYKKYQGNLFSFISNGLKYKIEEQIEKYGREKAIEEGGNSETIEMIIMADDEGLSPKFKIELTIESILEEDLHTLKKWISNIKILTDNDKILYEDALEEEYTIFVEIPFMNPHTSEPEDANLDVNITFSKELIDEIKK